MADNKKVFQIQINGITQSVDAVKTLKSELKDCEDIIKRLKNANIDVKVNAGATKTTEKVSNGKSSDDKVALDIEKEKTKQIEMQTEALREQYVERERLKQSNKESLDDIRQEAKGYVEVVDGVKEYANTLNGMAAELKDIKNELRNTDIDTDDFDKLTEKAAGLNEKLKKAEEAYGQFGRNVGNYTQSILDALDGWDENREFNVDLNVSGAENSLNDLKAQLKELKQYWSNLSPDDANFDKTGKAIKSLNQQIEDMESSIKDVGAEANSAFTGRFTTTIGGVEASFSNASEACEALRKKLVAMRVAGEENTPMYQEIIQLVRRLSKEVMIANQQVAGMTKTTQNMGKVIGVMKGLSSLAALGQGISGLFGGASEDLGKFIQKFASLTMVIAGLKELEELINSGQGAWGKFAQSANNALNSLFSWSDGIVNATKNTKDFLESQKALQKAEEELNNVLDNISSNELTDDMVLALQEQVQMSEQAIKGIAGLSDEWNDLQEIISSDYGFEELGEAVANLKNKFPELSEEIDKYAQAQVRLDNESEEAVDAFKKYQQALENKKNAEQESERILDSMGPKTKSFANGLQSLGGAGRIAAQGINLLTVSLKALAKATIVLFAIQLLAEAVELLLEGLKKLWSLAKMPFEWATFQQGEKEAKKLVSQIDSLNKKLNGLKQEREIQIKLGNVGEVEAQLKDLKDQFDMLKNQKITFDTDREFGEWQKQLVEAFKNIDKADSDWQNLTQSEKEAAEALEAIAQIEPDFFNKLKGLGPEKQLEMINAELKKVGLNSVNMSSLESMDTKALEELLEKLSGIDVDLNDVKADSVKAFAEFGKALMKARQDAASAAGSIKNDLDSLTKREYQLTLSLNDDDIKTRLAIVRLEMEALAQQYGFTMGKNNKGKSIVIKKGGKFTEEERAVAQRIARISDLEEEAARRANNAAKGRKNNGKANNAKNSSGDAKKSADDAKRRARAEANARIEAMEDGLDKEIAMLEQKRKEEIEDAKETGKRVVDINTIYDRQILEVKKKYAKYIEDAEREHARRLEDIARDFLTSWSQIQREIEDTRAETSMTNAENNNITVKQSITYDTNTQGSREGIDAQKKYYNDMLQSEIQYLNDKEQLEIEDSQREQQRLIEDENVRFNSLKEAQKKELEDLELSLKEKVDAHQLSEEEANNILQQTREEYQKGEARSQELHNEKIQSIVENGLAARKNIELQYDEDRKQATASALEEQRKVTQDFYNDIEKIMERTQKRNTNKFGFIDYKEYRQSLKDALDATNTVAGQIEQEKADLQAALNNNEISFDDFQKAKKELDDFSEEVKDKSKEMQNALNGSFSSWMQGVMNNVNQYASVLGGMFDTISEMYNRSLDAQQDKLDKQQELLDKELEMIEENLQKQEEITEQHNEKVNTIEDELKSARGDRRQALIDQLAAERKAQEESIKKEKELTEEKKKQAQKQEQLKKQQDALDKKRKQNEKRSAIVQATINTFTAVSNALAVEPWFVGLALSAVALGMGMANVAQIASQQYSDGGLLNGKRHSQGGMKIQGTNMEVEGGEYVTNRTSTSANLPLLEYINSNRRTLTKDDLIRFYDNGKTTLINRPMQAKFEEGGQLPQLSVNVKDLMSNAQAQQEDKQLVVSVVDIINSMENVQQVRVLAGDVDND